MEVGIVLKNNKNKIVNILYTHIPFRRERERERKTATKCALYKLEER